MNFRLSFRNPREGAEFWACAYSDPETGVTKSEAVPFDTGIKFLGVGDSGKLYVYIWVINQWVIAGPYSAETIVVLQGIGGSDEIAYDDYLRDTNAVMPEDAEVTKWVKIGPGAAAGWMLPVLGLAAIATGVILVKRRK